MSTAISKELHIRNSDSSTYLSLSNLQVAGNVFGSVYPNTDGTATLTDSAKNVLFPNSGAAPTKIEVSMQIGGASGSSYSSCYVGFRIGGTELFRYARIQRTGYQKNKDTYLATNYSVLNNCKKSSTLQFFQHYDGGFLTGVNVGSSTDSSYPSLKLTFWFNRYDFSATAGSNVLSASVSSSTGYDGDTITYSCVLADGATFDGWYDGSTRVSTSQSYTMTVSGADVVLTAVATMPVTTKTLSATYNGTQVSGFPKSVQSAVSLSYGGTSKGSIPLSGGTKTFSCSGKIANETININGTNLNNSGKLMATDVVVTVG